MIFLVGILAAIAIPAYQQYVQRAKVAQAARLEQQQAQPQAEPQLQQR